MFLKVAGAREGYNKSSGLWVWLGPNNTHFYIYSFLLKSETLEYNPDRNILRGVEVRLHPLGIRKSYRFQFFTAITDKPRIKRLHFPFLKKKYVSICLATITAIEARTVLRVTVTSRLLLDVSLVQFTGVWVLRNIPAFPGAVSKERPCKREALKLLFRRHFPNKQH